MPTYVHTMGKVGSVSVLYMLANSGRKATHMHYGVLQEGEFTSASQFLIGKRIASGKDHNRVITIVRHPLQRNLSAFFHSLGRYYTKDWYDPDDLLETFVTQYPHNTPQRWVDEDFFVLHGCDLNTIPFDPEIGWATWEGDNTEVLVMRTEDLDRVAVPAIQQFLGVDNLSLKRYNETANNWYRLLKRTLTFENNFVEMLNNLPYARNFYAAG